MSGTTRQIAAVRIAAAFAVLGFAAGCGAQADDAQPGGGAAPTAPAAQLGDEVVVAKGASVTVGDGVTVTFDAVSADSRCPQDKECVQEGDATVNVTVKSGDESSPVVFHTKKHGKDVAAASAHHVTLKSLTPAADSVTVVVEK